MCPSRASKSNGRLPQACTIEFVRRRWPNFPLSLLSEAAFAASNYSWQLCCSILSVPYTSSKAPGSALFLYDSLSRSRQRFSISTYADFIWYLT